MNTPIRSKMIDGVLKTPSQYLPVGFTCTGSYGNRSGRNKKKARDNNRKMTKGRSFELQIIVMKDGATKVIRHRGIRRY